MQEHPWINYNGEVRSQKSFHLTPDNRAFCYGDSLFETIIAPQGNIPLWTYHWDRVNRGMEALGYEHPPHDSWQSEQLKSEIVGLLAQNGLLHQTARVKIQVWRDAGGKYTPTQRGFHYLIATQATAIREPKLLNAGVSETVRLHYTPWSAFKTGSALPYIQAGRERQAKGWDEIILLNEAGEVAEAGASNLFWIKNSTIYSPSITTGCLAGVTRAALLDLFQKNAKKLSIGRFPLSELQEAEHIFAVNVAGANHLCRVGGREFEPWEPLHGCWKQLYAKNA